MKLYVVRHGQTDFNLNHLMQGITDTDLNDRGRRQINAIKRLLDNIEFDVCITSPLKRAVSTLKIITDHDYLVDIRLTERNLGVYESKEAETFDKKLYWDYKENSNVGGVEPIQDVFKRVEEFLNEIKSKYKNKKVLIVSHDAPIRVLNYIIKGYDENTNFLELEEKNGCILDYEI